MSAAVEGMIINIARALGWEIAGESYRIVWTDAKGQHVITVAHVQGGWTVRWDRGAGLTLVETGPHETLGDAMRALWGHIFRMADDRYEYIVAEAKRVMES